MVRVMTSCAVYRLRERIPLLGVIARAVYIVGNRQLQRWIFRKNRDMWFGYMSEGLKCAALNGGISNIGVEMKLIFFWERRLKFFD